eukprot:4204898-Lingulodinium_polyedra.AAC.1
MPRSPRGLRGIAAGAGDAAEARDQHARAAAGRLGAPADAQAAALARPGWADPEGARRPLDGLLVVVL